MIGQVRAAYFSRPKPASRRDRLTAIPMCALSGLDCYRPTAPAVDLAELRATRDPYGIKPLYFADGGGTLRFASQVKALLAGGADRFRIRGLFA